MRDSDVVKEIERMTNNRKETNMNIDQLIEDVVTQLDKDPMDQMVDTETIIREYTKKIVKECLDQCYNKGMNDSLYEGQLKAASYIEQHFGINDE